MTNKIFRSTVFVAAVVLLCSLGVVLGALLALVFAVMGKKLAVRLLMKMNIPVLMRRMISENSIVSSQNRQKISAGIFSVYAKYISPEDIHVYSIDECFLDVMLEFNRGYEAMKESLVRNFRYWQGEAREKLDLLLDNGLSGEMMQCALHWLESEHLGLPRRPGVTEKELEIITMVGTSGFFTLLMYWRRNDYRETPEEMADFAMQVLSEPLFPH